MSQVKFKGEPVEVNGSFPAKGAQAPAAALDSPH